MSSIRFSQDRATRIFLSLHVICLISRNQSGSVTYFCTLERSDKDEHLERLHDFIETLDNVERVEVLPYHTLGAYKWKELGYDYKLEGIDPPTQERIENANRILGDSEIFKIR